MSVEWPSRRLDVLAGLDALASEPEAGAGGQDGRWPDLRNAVHWVVDDTWWDHNHPAESVGTLLVSDDEAKAVGAMVSLIVEVSDRQRADAPDSAWYSDATWQQVRVAAKRAADLLRSNGM